MTTRIASTNIQSNTILTTNLAQSTIDALQGSTVPTITQIQITTSGYVVKDDTAVSTSGGYIKITGTNFTAGSQVVIGTVAATSVGFVNSTTLNVQVPAQAAGTYVVYVTINTGSVAIIVNGLTYSGDPTWVTGSTLPGGQVNSAISIQLSATGDAPVTYALQAGSSLPPGMSLTSGGLLSGTVTGISVDTTYNFTVEAIDAQSQESPRAFSINISASDEYWKYVAALFSANNPTSTFISDASTNQFLVTSFGDTQPNNFNPLTPGYYSNYFDGSTYFTTPGSSNYNFGSGDFTIEAWVYPITASTAVSETYMPVVGAVGSFSPSSNNWNFMYAVTGGNRLAFSTYESGTSYVVNSNSFTPVFNTWQHWACVRSSGTVTFYVNGVSIGGGSYSRSTSFGSLGIAVASMWGGGTPFSVNWVPSLYISNLRMVIGTAVYTSNFTPSTTPLTAVSGTQFLACNNARLIDGSANNATFTWTGNRQVSSFDPFLPSSSYTSYGSGYFDGTGDYIQIAASALQNLGTSDFTYECFWYPTTLGSRQALVCSAGDYWWGIDYQSDGKGLGMWASSNGTTWNLINADGGGNGITSTSPVIRAWNHIAASRTGGTWSLWLNGTRILNITGVTGSVVDRSNEAKRIGIWGGGFGFPLTGYISNSRMVIGSYVYDPTQSTITVPTSQLTAVANTVWLTLRGNQPINNNKFIDQSTNNFVMTASGNAHQGSFNPYAGGWSNYFDGTGDTLSVPDTTGFDLSSGDYTVECWIYKTGDSGTYEEWICGKREQGGGYAWSWDLSISNSDDRVYITNGATGIGSTTALARNTWYHVAAVRSGSTTTLYLNGVAQNSGTLAITNRSTPLTIGNYPVDNPTFTGYISNLRIVKGTAVYTSNFTPSSTPLMPIANTVLLTCQSARFVDNSPQNLTVTRSGDVQVNKWSPFTALPNYTPTSYSGYFDGTGDYLSAPSNAAFTFGTSDFTIEFWFNGPSQLDKMIYDNRGGVSTGYPHITTGLSTATLRWGPTDTSSSVVIADNTWHHCAVTRQSGTIKLWVDGVLSGSATDSTNYSINYQALIGSNSFTPTPPGIAGYISNFRIVKGTAVYTSNFTPSTTPLTAISGTSLLTCQSTQFIDNSTNNFTITVNGNSQTTIQNPFGYTAPTATSYTPASYSGSMYFDGNGDYVTIPTNTILNLGTNNFTLECWFYDNGSNSSYPGIISTVTGWSSGSFSLRYNNTGQANKFSVHWNPAGDPFISSSSTWPSRAWHHVALTRSGNTFTLYVNGINQGTGTSSNSFNLSYGGTSIGWSAWDGASGYVTGFVSDIRVVRGTLVYTGPFVPPVAPLTAVPNTVLLLNGANAGMYDSAMIANYQSIADARATTSLEKYGNSSMYFDGTGDYLTTLTNPNFAPRTGNFTWEAWVYFPSGSSYRQIFSTRTGPSSSSAAGSLAINPSNGLTWYTDSAIVDYTTNIGVNQWVHVAICRSGSTLRVFAGGVIVGSATNSQNLTASVLTIGANNDGSESFNGYMDDVRITNGAARYTANFTPPTSPVIQF